MSITQTLSRERSKWPWSRRFQVLFAVGIVLLAGDSLLNLAQVLRGHGLAALTACWEALKWISIGAFFGFVVDNEKSAATVASRRSAEIDRLYAELRPLMSRAVADPSLQGEVQAKLAHLRRLQSEEADEMEKRFEAGLLLKPGEGWQALKRADELLARYENPSSPNAAGERKN